MTAVLTDAATRDRISSDTDSTLFVNAGAGSGKTQALVDRVRTLVLRDGIRLRHIAAVTFTEKAGAELRDRLRAEFERERRGGDDAIREVVDEALDDLDGAAIGTLHAFAQRILTEHPIEAGLPPIIEVLDEVGSSVAFDERWAELQTALLDDDEIARPLLLGRALGMQLKQVRSLAVLLGKDWDLIADRILPGALPAWAQPDVRAFLNAATEVEALRRHCRDPDDKLLPAFDRLKECIALRSGAPDLESQLQQIGAFRALKFSYGRKGNWAESLDGIKDRCKALVQHADDLITAVLDQCLRQITRWLANLVLDAAETRRREGKLEFHDLLVLTRDLLRRDKDVRAALADDYQRLLLDEFQDTDPIQVELATRICGGARADAPRWQDIVVPPGRLFVVGDPKQSIYRFRRASIGTYLDAEQHIGEPVGLTTNFRTVAPILDWVNTVFGQLIQPIDGGQPAYVGLSHRRDAGGSGPAVSVLGAQPHGDLPRAAASLLRQLEADDVAGIIRQALDEGWQVCDQRSGEWRPVCSGDIAVLVPARTSLSFLEAALDDAKISYRAEASSLVYQATEVRDLLACARAIADTSDGLALVTVLRSPVFGCGDDDLWRWRHAGGRFSIFAELDDAGFADDGVGDGPVGSALKYLRRLNFASRWSTPSEVLGTIIADRRMLEVAATGPRARDGWRRLRFVVDQARAWSEVSHGGLRAYLAWAKHQGQEVTRVAESVLPEIDTDSVRVMTIHAAKGLEFPMVILSGMTAQPRNNGGVAISWPPDGGYAVRLTKFIQTGDFEAAAPIDEQMDDLERLRLLYVAATRARDHLVVSLHRDVKKTGTAARSIAEVGGADAVGATPFSGQLALPAISSAAVVTQPPPYDAWLAGLEAARLASRQQPALTASGLEGTEPDVVLPVDADAGAAVEPGSAKGPRDLDLPPWSKGRYGSAIGRAVHGVLQSVDLTSGSGLDGAVAAQSMTEGVLGHEPLVRALVESALGSAAVQRAAAREHWRETYVGTVLDDGTVLEGYIDLVYREDDGSLMIVDYKTDAVPAGAIDSRVGYYKPQMDAYRQALGAATSATVGATLLFLNPGASVEVRAS